MIRRGDIIRLVIIAIMVAYAVSCGKKDPVSSDVHLDGLAVGEVDTHAEEVHAEGDEHTGDAHLADDVD